MGRLEGKVAVITGGVGGIGKATAERFLAEGARVVLADLDAGAVEAAVAELGPHCVGVAADIAREADNQRLVATAVARFGGLDVFFANAGIEGRVAPLTAQTEADFDRVLGVNLKGAWFGIRAAAPALQARGGGSIVVTSSVAGFVGSPGLGPYVASKHAVMGLVKTAAVELAALGIRVNTVNPGPVDNRMMRSIEDQAAPGAGDQVKKGFEAMVPLRRYATNEEIASVALFLACDDSRVLTGTSVVADGGFLIQ